MHVGSGAVLFICSHCAQRARGSFVPRALQAAPGQEFSISICFGLKNKQWSRQLLWPRLRRGRGVVSNSRGRGSFYCPVSGEGAEVFRSCSACRLSSLHFGITSRYVSELPTPSSLTRLSPRSPTHAFHLNFICGVIRPFLFLAGFCVVNTPNGPRTIYLQTSKVFLVTRDATKRFQIIQNGSEQFQAASRRKPCAICERVPLP